MTDSQQTQYTTTSYIGRTTRGNPKPVFFDTHTAIANNKPPGTVVTGEPGSGKTFFLQLLTVISTLIGKNTIVIDYKGDFLALTALEDEIGKVRVWDLSGDGEAGSIDPFIIGQNHQERVSMAVSLIDILLGGMSQDVRNAITPAITDMSNSVAKNKRPCMMNLVNDLRASHGNILAQQVGNTLKSISERPSAKACFANNRTVRQDSPSIGSSGLTVVSLLGLNLPDSPEEATGTEDGRIVSGLLYLVTKYIIDTLKRKETKVPTTMVIDEAWSMLSTKQGQNVIKSTALLGRSLNFAYVLATQNYSHLDSIDIDNTVSTHMAFSAQIGAARKATASMGLKDPNGYFAETISDLELGECLMRDYRKPPRFSTVRIETGDRFDWEKVFSTNPYADKD